MMLALTNLITGLSLIQKEGDVGIANLGIPRSTATSAKFACASRIVPTVLKNSMENKTFVFLVVSPLFQRNQQTMRQLIF